MFKYVSINTMYDSSAKQKRIIFVSDMLHHTEQYSHYRRSIDFESFAETPYSIEVKPYLNDVNIEVLYVVRAKDRNLQNRGHIAFWEDFVSNAGGDIVRVKTIN